ncbi:MAG: flagellin [Candidatus Marinimicrobia bacterium]|nr:flagellin [Candidatus Neomarinimicrobiota bacterium]
MSELMKIAANIQAMWAYQSLSDINKEIGVRQLRLSTGRKINSTEEDPAGYQLARTLERRRRGLEVALQNVSNAQNILNVAEGGYQNIMDILQTLKEKATQAADYSLSSSQREAIQDQVTALISEIDDIVSETTFNTYNLIDGSYNGKFHTGEGAADELSISLHDADSAALQINNISVATAASASAAISTLSQAIDNLAGWIQDVGEYKVRLSSKEQTLSVAITNTEAVRSTIEDADFAREQMELMKLQILQQTAVSSYVQANVSPQLVLSLFR